MLILTIHVALSFAAILAGLILVPALLGGRLRTGWAAALLALTALTSVTGFLLPIPGFTPAVGTGILALLASAVVVYPLFTRPVAGALRSVLAGGLVLITYLSFLVLVAQAFKHVPFLNVFAPKGSEPPFVITQLIVLVVFIAIGVLAVKRLRTTANV